MSDNVHLSGDEREKTLEIMLNECREKVASGNGNNLAFGMFYQYKELLEILETDPGYILDSLRNPFKLTEEDGELPPPKGGGFLLHRCRLF